MSIAVQTGAYPDGAARMKTISADFADGNEMLAAYADYAAINSQYVVRQTPDADFAKVQEWYIDALDGFVERYPKTPEAAKAWLQLALVKEFDENETEALDYYKKVALGFPGTDEGFKADGAIRRLESVGQKIELEGTTIDGKPFRLSKLTGKPVVIHYWATWCEPCKQDMQLLRRLQAAYVRTGLQLVGVNVDGTKEQAQAFITESRLPWTQLFEPGGLEGSSLANRLGVQTLPTILLIDAEGKVVRHNIQAAELDAELQKMTKKR
jgi:thiol-disulfide isomerase/thioredoxin